MRKFASCSRFASRPPCSCGGRTVWTDNRVIVAAADGRVETPCDPVVCKMVGRVDRAVGEGRTVRLRRLHEESARARSSYAEDVERLIRERCAEVRPGQNQYACIVGGMQRRSIESKAVAALKIGNDRYQSLLIDNVLRCVGRGTARMGFARQQAHGVGTTVDLLALGDRGGSWSAGIMPLMPDQPHHAEASPESLSGRRRR